MSINVLQATGFVLAGYSVMSNDCLQTLGAYFSSNEGRTPKYIQAIFICSVLSIVLLWGWSIGLGDPAWGRLEKFPLPSVFTWIYLIPPVTVMLLTRWGAPVSTTFLVLTAFQPKNVFELLTKSLSGYLLACLLGGVLYGVVIWLLERRVLRQPGTAKPIWFVLQWLSTGWLWSQWLIQDLANIYVYLPRQLSALEMVATVSALCAGICVLIKLSGGPIQHVVRSKTNTDDLRSAAIIDLIYGFILFYFAQVSKFPMSTTWVFLGLLSGREVALYLRLRTRQGQEVRATVVNDAFKAGVGLAVSIAIALLIQPLKSLV